MGTNKELQLLERLFTDLTNESNPKRLHSGITDLFVRINTETGEVGLYGDDDELICSLVIFSWISSQGVTPNMVEAIRLVIERLNKQGYWSNELFERPFSIDFVAEDFTTLENFLFLDDELVKISEPILQGLGEELDNFLDRLLEDLK